MTVEVKGKGNITARIIADSVSSVNGKRITTFELEYHRYIHSEFMTHRLISRNSASSRAIPVKAMLGNIKSNPAMPIHWGKNQAGMQAKDELDSPLEGDSEFQGYSREDYWKEARDIAIIFAEEYNRMGYHKQIVNRLTEPFQMMKVVATATEWDNFFHLRKHSDSQPEIAELARCMWEALQQSTPEVLQPGEWHTPYVKHHRSAIRGLEYIVEYSGKTGYEQEADYVLNVDGQEYQVIPFIDALKISASCCAQVSYRKQDDSLEKAIDIYNRLVESKPVHASPFEHQATPSSTPYNEHWHTDGSRGWFDGITHVDVSGNFWSGNFKSWIQHRQLIPDNACWDYKENNND